MKNAEIREIPAAELGERIETEVAKYNQMRMNHAISPLANPSELKTQRRLIARLETEQRRRELNK